MSAVLELQDRYRQTPAVGDTLEILLAESLGSSVRISTLDRRPSEYSSSFRLEELDVTLRDGTTLALMLKDLSRVNMLDGARRARPAFLDHPEREIATYQRLLGQWPMGTATFYGASVDEEAGRFWLFLERVPGLQLRHVGDFGVWEGAARWLAQMHSRFAQGVEELLDGEGAHLLVPRGDHYRRWWHRAEQLLCQSLPTSSPSQQNAVRWLFDTCDDVVERILALPTTFIHGEFYGSNVVVDQAGPMVRLCPLDWETAAVAPGLLDLAGLVAGSWTDDQQRALLLAYRSALSPVPEESFDDHLSALRCCQLLCSVQWLGWASDWVPPPDHAQDWLCRGVQLAEELGF